MYTVPELFCDIFIQVAEDMALYQQFFMLTKKDFKCAVQRGRSVRNVVEETISEPQISMRIQKSTFYNLVYSVLFCMYS